MIRSKVSRNFVLLAPPSCGEVSANKSANEGALIFLITLLCSVPIKVYHLSFVQRFLKKVDISTLVLILLAIFAARYGLGKYSAGQASIF